MRFLCPEHEDHRPSAMWNPEKAVWCCPACGAKGGAHDLAARLGVELSAAQRMHAPNATTVYPIRDSAGRLVAEHIRIERPGGEKTFTWRRDGRSGLQGLRVAELPLYGTDRVGSFARSRPVFLCEGEKATDCLVRIGAQAVGTATGAGAVPAPSSLGVLQGIDVRRSDLDPSHMVTPGRGAPATRDMPLPQRRLGAMPSRNCHALI